MTPDKTIHPKDLPQPRQDADTKQAEEFVDQSSVRKDEGEPPAQNTRRNDKDGPTPRNQ